MAITLAKLCEDTEKKYNMKLLAGSGGLENIVRWVHMVEDREVPDFLHGNELVFTTGIGHINGGGGLTTFVKNLREHSAVGVVINLGPYISYVPEEVVRYCEANDFPLYTLPWEIHIIDITFDFCRRIIENEKYEVSVAEAFKNIIVAPSEISSYLSVFEKSGFSQSSNFRILIVDFFQGEKKVTEWVEENNRMKLWKSLTRSSHASTMFIKDGRIVVIRQNCDQAEMGRVQVALQKSIESTHLDFIIGYSDDECGLEYIPMLYKQALAAHTTALAEHKQIAGYHSIGMDKLILGVESYRVLESFVAGVLSPISTYDKHNKTDYEKTLREYLDNGGSVKAVAEKSGVHRNTINYKIKQIREIFNLELSEREKAELILAFRIKDLLKYI